MFPHLDEEQRARGMTDADMAAVIGKSRSAYRRKRQSGKLTAGECARYCRLFGRSFDDLFAEEEGRTGNAGRS